MMNLLNPLACGTLSDFAFFKNLDHIEKGRQLLLGPISRFLRFLRLHAINVTEEGGARVREKYMNRERY